MRYGKLYKRKQLQQIGKKNYICTAICRGGGIGRRTGLKILWVFAPVPVRVRPSVQQLNLVIEMTF